MPQTRWEGSPSAGMPTMFARLFKLSPGKRLQAPTLLSWYSCKRLALWSMRAYQEVDGAKQILACRRAQVSRTKRPKAETAEVGSGD